MTALEQLPGRMDRLESRIDRLELQLRNEIRAGDEGTRRVLRDEIRAGDEETRRVLREEIQTGNVMIVTALTEQIEESRRHTRVLFEDMQSRLATIHEGVTARRRKKSR